MQINDEEYLKLKEAVQKLSDLSQKVNRLLPPCGDGIGPLGARGWSEDQFPVDTNEMLLDLEVISDVVNRAGYCIESYNHKSVDPVCPRCNKELEWQIAGLNNSWGRYFCTNCNMVITNLGVYKSTPKENK